MTPIVSRFRATGGDRCSDPEKAVQSRGGACEQGMHIVVTAYCSACIAAWLESLA